MSQELKSGSTAVYEIGGKELRLTPMPWGRLKRALKLFSESWGTYDANMTNDTPRMMKWIVTMIETRMDDMFPLLIDEKLNTFFTKDWVDENITLQHIQQIVMDAVKINGVKDFLALGGKVKNQHLPLEKVLEPVAV